LEICIHDRYIVALRELQSRTHSRLMPEVACEDNKLGCSPETDTSLVR